MCNTLLQKFVEIKKIIHKILEFGSIFFIAHEDNDLIIIISRLNLYGLHGLSSGKYSPVGSSLGVKFHIKSTPKPFSLSKHFEQR